MIRPRNPAIRILALLVSGVLFGLAAWYSRSHRAAPLPAPAPTAPAPAPSAPSASPVTDPAILAAIEKHRRHIWGQAVGTVQRLLDDDHRGIPHQRFVIQLASGGTVLVEYNLDLAPRITPLAVGDTVVVRGEYLWNEQGGLIHWTHRDPSGGIGGGWVKLRGKTYQ